MKVTRRAAFVSQPLDDIGGTYDTLNSGCTDCSLPSSHFVVSDVPWTDALSFQAALAHAIAAGDERIEALQATVQLRRRTKLPV
jgi:hypothetical protein